MTALICIGKGETVDFQLNPLIIQVKRSQENQMVVLYSLKHNTNTFAWDQHGQVRPCISSTLYCTFHGLYHKL